MNHENCPSWICNDQGIPYDVYYGIAALIVAIPYLLLIYVYYKKNKEALQHKNSGCIFIILILVGYVLYTFLMAGLLSDSKNEVISFLGLVSYGPSICTIFLIFLALIGLLFLQFLNFDGPLDEE